MANSKSNVSEKNYFDIPVWRRYTLTIEEAAGYYQMCIRDSSYTANTLAGGVSLEPRP